MMIVNFFLWCLLCRKCVFNLNFPLLLPTHTLQKGETLAHAKVDGNLPCVWHVSTHTHCHRPDFLLPLCLDAWVDDSD